MIRPAFEADIPRLEPLAREFYASSEHLKDFSLEQFTALWLNLIRSGKGVIYLIVDEKDEISGALGGVTYPDAYSSKIIAQEMFFFVGAEHRGGGVRLYKPFERWAELSGCSEIRMVHLVDLMPEKVSNFYKRLGFHQIEVCYSKELQAA